MVEAVVVISQFPVEALRPISDGLEIVFPSLTKTSNWVFPGEISESPAETFDLAT